jgi:hypothetical protein
MRKVPLLLLLVGLTVIPRLPGEENLRLESIEWTDIWVTNANHSDLPRVLLVGDSITRGYFSAVEKNLTGKASCARYASSMFLGNPDYLDELKVILRRYQFRVIHINNGLHGWDYTEEEYRQSLPKLMETLRKYGKGAAVIWATTTPRRSSDNPDLLAPDTDRVKERNRIAVAYMTQHGITVDDLFSLVAEHPEYYSGDHTHFDAEGQDVEGKQVSETILRVLTGPSVTRKGQ